MRRIVIAMASLALLLAACGKSSSSSSKSSSSGSPPVSLSGQVNDKGTKDYTKGSGEIEVDSFYFNPTYVKAAPGSTLQLELSNESKTTHTFTIDALKIDEEVPAGAKHTVAVTVPA